MRRVASAISQQRLFQENLEVWKITPVVVERDFSLIDGYGVIAGCYGKIVTLRYNTFAQCQHVVLHVTYAMHTFRNSSAADLAQTVDATELHP